MKARLRSSACWPTRRGALARRGLTASYRGLAAALSIALLTSCGGGGGSPTSAGPSCASIAGTWSASFANSCGGQGSGTVTIAQSACSVSATFPGQAVLQGTVSGNQIDFSLQFVSPCGGGGSGTAQVSGNSITGNYSGNATGGAPLCCGQVSGTFSLQRR
jgi:hypothetical protein